MILILNNKLLRFGIYFQPVNVSFSKILIPIDLSVNTEVAIRKALELCEPGAVIHLHHVSKISETHINPPIIHIHIRLVTFLDEHKGDKSLPAPLIRIYRTLKTNPAINVSCYVLKEKNKAKSILDYYELVNADLLILNSRTETRAGWPNQYISDVLPKKSKTQILAI